ncbi:PAS domain-containing protein [Paenibacillus athensensis]|uniref:histidine kinase n=1 Tax=Paenibacillus athensensis TaxID=1967502 RepID=A0A4Y8PRQ4_9BACL|nr:histidine kinase N-terminal 7TM domain-containing protein [Paenibacillus athensensis]MCD1259298.1 PAS domain-containing protein [Paenibacillus athensensis]
MKYHFYLAILLIAGTCCSMILVYLSWKRRELPIAISYGLGVLTGAFYSFGYAFEIVSTNLEQIRFWLRIQYIGIPFGTVFWMMLVLQYTGREAWVRKWLVGLLLVVPVITLFAHYTNEWHHLFYTHMSLTQVDGFPFVHLEKGPFYKIHVVYNYVIFAVGMGMLIRMYAGAGSRMRKQIAFMIVGSWGPYGFTLVYLSGIIPSPVDVSPFGFLVSGICFLWGIYQFDMLRLAPLASQKVFASMQDAILVFDLEGRLTEFNEAARLAIAGLQRKSRGQPALLVLAEYPELLEQLTARRAFVGKLQLPANGNDRSYQIQVAMLGDSQQHPVGTLLQLSDVTEAVHAEERLQANARQLAELNDFKDKMFNVLAHDIRDPLAVLINLMELLEDEMAECPTDHREIVEEMGQQVQNTFVLVESLLDWFRGQRGGMVFDPVARGLAQAVEANLKLLQVPADNKEIRIVSEIADDIMVCADKEMLDFIMRNLLSNAIKFTTPGGSIRIGAETGERRVVFSIRDSGEGMPVVQADMLLKESYPLPMTGTAGERGVGLGLSLCREFVRLNRGEIWFESAPGQGTTFYVSLPCPDLMPELTMNGEEG